MDDFFASGRIIDLILGLMVLESAALIVHRRIAGGGVRPTALLTNMAAGACLLLALRAALTAAGWPVIAGALAVGLAMHVFDLRCRWHPGTRPSLNASMAPEKRSSRARR